MQTYEENILDDFCGKKDEDDNEDETVDAVVHVVQRRPLHRDEGCRRQNRRQDDEEGHVAGDRAVLHLKKETKISKCCFVVVVIQILIQSVSRIWAN